MKGTPNTFWGKLHRDKTGAITDWHPLLDHCADIAACMERLLSQPNISKRISRIGGVPDLIDIQKQRLCVLAALHDVGKFNAGFQNKALSKPPFVAGHVSETVWLLNASGEEKKKFLELLQLHSMNGWAKDDDALVRLFIASICHHGKPVSCNSRNASTHLWKPQSVNDPFEGMELLLKKVREWFPLAFEDKTGHFLPSISEFQHVFSGFVMLADWLGSDENFFPFTQEDDGNRMAFSRKQTIIVFDQLFINPQKAVNALGKEIPSFETIFGITPKNIQITADSMMLEKNGSVTIFEAETGSGKTEASFRHFLRLFHQRKIDGMYFALPTRTAATQMHARICGYANKAFGEDAPPVTLAVPGYIQTDDKKGEKLTGFEVLWNDDDEERWRFRGWASEHPKRYLAGCIVVGTVDQVLLSVLTVSHAHMRMSALFRQLLVVDEVHASDAYMIRILKEVLERHIKVGGHALLMSATLASEMRLKLLGLEENLSLKQAIEIPFPAAWNGGELCKVPETGRTKIIKASIIPAMTQSEEIARIALDAAAKDAKVVVLRNTVNGALAVQEAIEKHAPIKTILFACNGSIAPHHARFAKEDRQSLDKALETYFGGNRIKGGCIVVATQTIQQSLDIDADFLVTDLCPMDILLQRIGRLHRHSRQSEQRPLEFREPQAVVLVPEERNLTGFIHHNGKAHGPHGIGTVYPDLRILEATWRLLERYRSLEIPLMNRELVEGSIHSEVLNVIVREKGDLWKKHSNSIWGKMFSQTQIAGLNLIDWTQEFGEYHFGDVGEMIKTRLGEGDRIVQFESELDSPFGNKIRFLTLPYYWVSTAGKEEKPEKIESTNGYISFRFGKKEFIYDRLGIRPLKKEEKDDRVDV